MDANVAILMVNGGNNPKDGAWYRLCIDSILQHTVYPHYHLYVWNNATTDTEAVRYLRSQDRLTLFQANDFPELTHPHLSALNNLYRAISEERPGYIVTMDSDAHPIRRAWLTDLVSALDDETVLAGVYRQELAQGITPYIHPCCLCTTTAYVNTVGLPLDFVRRNTPEEKHDALSFLTEEAEARGLKSHRLVRSNQREVHRIIGGIYGDRIYHHGAGSRSPVWFWDDAGDTVSEVTNRHVATVTAAVLFQHYADYINWLRGGEAAPEIAQTLEKARDFSPTPSQVMFALGRRGFNSARYRLNKSLARVQLPSNDTRESGS